MAEGNGVADFLGAASRDGDGSANLLSDADIEAVMTAAIKVYTLRAEQSGKFPPPISSRDATATEVVTVVSEMLRAVDVNMFDLSMWYRRPRG
jgi:hypothetical protein